MGKTKPKKMEKRALYPGRRRISSRPIADHAYKRTREESCEFLIKGDLEGSISIQQCDFTIIVQADP